MSEDYQQRYFDEKFDNIKTSIDELKHEVRILAADNNETKRDISNIKQWKHSVERQLKALSVKKGGSINNISAKTIYILALVVAAVVSLLAVALGNPIEWLRP